MSTLRKRIYLLIFIVFVSICGSGVAESLIKADRHIKAHQITETKGFFSDYPTKILIDEYKMAINKI